MFATTTATKPYLLQQGDRARGPGRGLPTRNAHYLDKLVSEGIEFAPYPSVEECTATLQQAALGDSTHSRSSDETTTGLFVGQLPRALTECVFQWAVNYVLGAGSAVRFVPFQNHDCGRLHLRTQELETHLLRKPPAHRWLFDVTGFWYTRSEEASSLLKMYLEKVAKREIHIEESFVSMQSVTFEPFQATPRTSRRDAPRAQTSPGGQEPALAPLAVGGAQPVPVPGQAHVQFAQVPQIPQALLQSGIQGFGSPLVFQPPVQQSPPALAPLAQPPVLGQTQQVYTLPPQQQQQQQQALLQQQQQLLQLHQLQQLQAQLQAQLQVQQPVLQQAQQVQPLQQLQQLQQPVQFAQQAPPLQGFVVPGSHSASQTTSLQGSTLQGSTSLELQSSLRSPVHVQLPTQPAPAAAQALPDVMLHLGNSVSSGGSPPAGSSLLGAQQLPMPLSY